MSWLTSLELGKRLIFHPNREDRLARLRALHKLDQEVALYSDRVGVQIREALLAADDKQLYQDWLEDSLDAFDGRDFEDPAEKEARLAARQNRIDEHWEQWEKEAAK